MIHRSEKKPSGVLTVVIAIAGIFVLLAASTGAAASQPLVFKSVICVLSLLMMNRVGVMSTPTFIATLLFAALIVVENPLIPFNFSEKNWTIIRLSGAALFAFSAIHALVSAAAAEKRARETVDKRSQRVGFR